MQAAPHRGLHVFVSLSLPGGTASMPVREKGAKQGRAGGAVRPFSRPCARADRRKSAALFAYSPEIHCRDRLPAGGSRIRTFGPAEGARHPRGLGSGFAPYFHGRGIKQRRVGNEPVLKPRSCDAGPMVGESCFLQRRVGCEPDFGGGAGRRQRRAHVNELRRAIRDETSVNIEDCSSNLTATTDPTGSRQLREFERAIAQLPEEQRQVLLLVGLEGMDYQQTADILNIPIGTVRSRLSRGREFLRKLMGTRPCTPIASRSIPSTASGGPSANTTAGQYPHEQSGRGLTSPRLPIRTTKCRVLPMCGHR